MNIKNIMRDLSVKLSKVSLSPDLDSEILLMKALRVSRAYLHTYNDKVISESEKTPFFLLGFITFSIYSNPFSRVF